MQIDAKQVSFWGSAFAAMYYKCISFSYVFSTLNAFSICHIGLFFFNAFSIAYNFFINICICLRGTVIFLNVTSIEKKLFIFMKVVNS